jgi:hypothetical protein
MCICTSSTQIWSFKPKLFTQTAIRTVFVAVAQKLGNPTSYPGAHFRHQNLSISQWNTQSFCSIFCKYNVSVQLQNTEKFHCIKSFSFCVIYLWNLITMKTGHSIIPRESAPQKLSNEWSCPYVSTIWNVLGQILCPAHRYRSPKSPSILRDALQIIR